MDCIELKYGCNPNQQMASISMHEGKLPLTVLNGKVGYINLLDALNGWQLVNSLSKATGLASAASFKHVSPAGAAVGLPLNEGERLMYFISEKTTLSELATAYVRARGADRMSSFGDFISLSGECDLSTAQIIKSEVSDGVIAPSYSKEALEVLKKKKGGSYTILQIDPAYEPPLLEERSVFGITFKQMRNTQVLDRSVLTPIVTINTTLSAEAQLDLLVALNTLKYTQSNSVCYAKRGQTIGVGAGQQSRIHCTRLAGDKADLWHLRQSESVLSLPFLPQLSRNDKDNAVELFLRSEMQQCQRFLSREVQPLHEDVKRAFLSEVHNVSLASDAFFPFRDNIDRAFQSGVSYIVQSGGSLRDDEVIQACDAYGMVMITNGIRLFHH
ncbi:phosphoribosylaminoimidazolecarboxamide formyltransferase [Sphaerochaeta globosa]|uniref:Phosphoribosylaminoimidazolecarboxamide formyltransferase n=1 Tax=Sphaerochaeta globosa (strain ATCC BAA-1886 / DSM 22777 / Buddy) TaxID=158189 RepID=F0RSS0_SPHGB|nr:phosphoribosylaminoimidazolecarboxamide formyltransferase [Sphaerochaeta globosa]ADY13970.1 Phosphoribosylaminoimidazolecarboxamide formyltransferase [Sphaerochaeta globosa str. Buddy]